jgi:dihydroflavonol-4-reductase
MVLVTGATGHIGNVLVKRLLNEGQDVGILIHDKAPTTVFPNLNVKVFQGDVTDYQSLVSAFQHVEIVYHLAAKISITSGEFATLEKINVQGTANVVKACLHSGVKRLVYTSSIHAIYEQPHGIELVEKVPDTVDGVIGDYAKSKVLAYKEVMKGVAGGLDAVVVFPTGVIGPFDYKPSQIGLLIKNFLVGKTNYYIDGAYDYVDVRDVVQGILLAAAKGKAGEGYILGGNQLTVSEMYRVLQSYTGIKAKLNRIPTWLAYFISFFAEAFAKMTKQEPLLTPYSVTVLKSNSWTSHRKAEKELGYRSRPIKETLADSVDWHQGKSVSLT